MILLAIRDWLLSEHQTTAARVIQKICFITFMVDEIAASVFVACSY